MEAIARITLSIPSALIAMLAIGAAHAESYEGVLTLESQRPRSSVLAEAVAAANAPDQNVVPGSRGGTRAERQAYATCCPAAAALSATLRGAARKTRRRSRWPGVLLRELRHTDHW